MRTLFSLAAAACFAISAGAALAQDYPTYSEWDSNYDTAEGYSVHSHVILHDDRGNYFTDQNARGSFYGIQCTPAVNQPEGVMLVAGSWRFQNGQSGWFKFHVNRQWSRFSGIWGFAGSRTAYAWNGRRVQDDAPVPLAPNQFTRPQGPSVVTRPFDPGFSPSFPSGGGRPSFPSGGGRPSGGGPIIGDAGQIPGGTQRKFDANTNTTTFFDSNGRFLGSRRGN